jgi:4-carboxymuconolactone decarboxylase
VRELTINHLFAKIWSRSTETDCAQRISLRERRLVTIALLAAQGRHDQLKDHVTGAYRAGLGETELIDLMIHVAHYAGWPAGTSGQTTVQDVFKSAKKTMYVVFFRAVTTAEKRQKFIEFLKWDAKVAMEREPGSLRFDVFEDPGEANAFYVYEAYADEAAFEEHKRNAPYKDWDSRVRHELIDFEEVFSGAPVCSSAESS